MAKIGDLGLLQKKFLDFFIEKEAFGRKICTILNYKPIFRKNE
jgi:hypothetical protein